MVDPVVAEADYAGRLLAAANASVPLPDDPLVAPWQQLTVLREWRGDAHVVVLGAHRLDPCECNLVQIALGQVPAELVLRTRQWNDDECARATARLVARGWFEPDGSITEVGRAARERIEVATDELCAPLWAPIGEVGARRLAALIAPIHEAVGAAGTYR